MAVYVVSDLHGQYQAFMAGLERIGFGENDELYLIGDAIDRGPDGIRILSELQKNQNMHDFDEFTKQKPLPCKEPLDIAGYLHMCRIAYDAAPMFVYPDFISDLYVVSRAKFDSCGLTKRRTLDEKMKTGDTLPLFMHYHPEEMGFGGPCVHF